MVPVADTIHLQTSDTGGVCGELDDLTEEVDAGFCEGKLIDL